MEPCHLFWLTPAGVKDGWPATSPASEPPRRHSPGLGRLSKAEWPRWASSAAGEKSRRHRRGPSATGTSPTRAAREGAETTDGPCWPRRHIRREPFPAEDVGPW